MNAEQARELSFENANQLAEKQLIEAIEEMEKQIKTSATKGLYEAAITVARSGPWEEHSNSRRLKDYFHKLKFGMEVVEYPGSTSFRAFW